MYVTGFFGLFLVTVCVSGIRCDSQDVYDIGVGIGDVTGPAADINMMGYAKMSQVTGGIHTRLYSRAFIIGDNSSRVVIVSVDTAMISQLVKLEVVKMLKEKYGEIYREDNVCITATHTHSTPGGYLQYLLYLIPSQGFVKQSFKAQVKGIIKSIDRAHTNITAGYIYWNSGELLNASINRSPSAYRNNPPEERSRYSSNVDKEMIILKFTDLQNKPRGIISWFPVHPTSMNNSNKLISGDNKGYASLRFEEAMNGHVIPGKGPFVAAFAQSNSGDVSPNILGTKCFKTGEPCDDETSTCKKKNDKCIGKGPGKDMFESTKIIGERQYKKAMELFESASEKLSGPILYIHQYIDMSNVEITVNDSVRGVTCKPALGYSFAAGTTDSPGEHDFYQGTTNGSRLWNFVRDFIRRPSESLSQCHYPKPILLATGEMKFPYKWQPDIVPTQIIMIGKFAILAVPAEFTTMAGRRLREAIKKVLDESRNSNDTVTVISGLSNAYSSYTTTIEEYQVQRYEGASTIYGPHTLEAYISQFEMLANNLALRHDIFHGPEPANLLTRQISLVPMYLYDGVPLGRRFGEVLKDVSKSYAVGSKVSVTFVSGNPRNDLKLEDTFLAVERWNNETKTWNVIATDANWETRFYWKRTNSLLAESQATITWDIPEDTKPGVYRIRHFGSRKNFVQHKRPFSGVSGVFNVTPKEDAVKAA